MLRNMEDKFFDSLYEGDSTNGFKLGMGLTGGDFWPRVSGCQNLYRGQSIESVDFNNILAVADISANSVSIPSYLEHESNEVYFYIIRRVNICGNEEHSLNASVKAVFDSEGDLVEPAPNRICCVKAEQIETDIIRLVWLYCSIEQENIVSHFNIYWNDGSGEIDYENPVGVIDYIGPRFYTYASEQLDGNKYKFCIRAEAKGEAEYPCLDQVDIYLNTTKPDAAEILQSQQV